MAGAGDGYVAEAGAEEVGMDRGIGLDVIAIWLSPPKNHAANGGPRLKHNLSFYTIGVIQLRNPPFWTSIIPTFLHSKREGDHSNGGEEGAPSEASQRGSCQGAFEGRQTEDNCRDSVGRT